MKTQIRFFCLLAAVLTMLIACSSSKDTTWKTLNTNKQKEVDVKINAFLDQQLKKLRNKIDGAPCNLNVLNTPSLLARLYPSGIWRNEHPAKFRGCGESYRGEDSPLAAQVRWRSGVVWDDSSNALRADWWGNFDRMKELLEQKLQPLAARTFYPYTPYGPHLGRREFSRGVEFLLRDGRTVLGLSRANGPLQTGNYQTEIQLSVFDVRTVPPRASWLTYEKNYGRGAAADDFDHVDRFSTQFEVPVFSALTKWALRYNISRRFDLRVLDPEQVRQVQLEPEVQQLGKELALTRWERMKFVAENISALIKREQGRADAAWRSNLAWHKRDVARKKAQWAQDGAASAVQTNAIAAGIIDGLNSAARTQQFWNARAAEAQARYFQAQYGCQPGFCGGGDNYGAGRGRNDRDNGNDKRRRDADAAHASSAAAGSSNSAAGASGRPESTQTAAASGKGTGSTAASTSGSGSNSAAGGAASAGASGSSTVAKPLTHYVTGQYAKAGTEAQACAAAKLMTALKSSDRDKLTGKVADKCVCSNPGAGWQKMLDNDRRKRDEATEQWIKEQYTAVIDKRQAKINTEGWSCHADFEVYGAGAPTR